MPSRKGDAAFSIILEGRGKPAELRVPADALRAVGLGATAGLRSMSPPALLGQAVRRGDLANLQTTPFAAAGRLSPVLQVLAIGEIAADKLPFAPSRNLPPALIARVLSGALVAGALYASRGRRAASGAPLGAAAAAIASLAGERLRVSATQRLGLPNAALGLLEDGLVVLLGSRLLGRT